MSTRSIMTKGSSVSSQVSKEQTQTVNEASGLPLSARQTSVISKRLKMSSSEPTRSASALDHVVSSSSIANADQAWSGVEQSSVAASSKMPQQTSGHYLNDASRLAAAFAQQSINGFEARIQNESPSAIATSPLGAVSRELPFCSSLATQGGQDKTLGLYPEWTFKEDTNGTVNIKLDYVSSHLSSVSQMHQIKDFSDPLCDLGRSSFLLMADKKADGFVSETTGLPVHLGTQEFSNFASRFIAEEGKDIEAQLAGKVAVVGYQCEDQAPEQVFLPFFVLSASNKGFSPVLPVPNFQAGDCREPQPTATYTINSQPTLGFYQSSGFLSNYVPNIVVTNAAHSSPTATAGAFLAPVRSSENFQSAKKYVAGWAAGEMAVMGLSLFAGLGLLLAKRTRNGKNTTFA